MALKIENYKDILGSFQYWKPTTKLQLQKLQKKQVVVFRLGHISPNLISPNPNPNPNLNPNPDCCL